MRFIRKKNLLEGEELLYVPQLHWFYTVKHMVLSLPFFLVLLILWNMTKSADLSNCLSDCLVQDIPFTQLVIRNVFLAAVLVILLVFVWRIFQYLSSEYGITNKRLIMKKGIIRLIVSEIPVDRIESIYCYKGLLGSIFRYGTITISGIGGMMPVFKMVHRPYAFRRKIVEIIEKNKAITVVHGELPRAKPAAKPEPAAQEEPIYRYGTFVRVISDSRN